MSLFFGSPVAVEVAGLSNACTARRESVAGNLDSLTVHSSSILSYSSVLAFNGKFLWPLLGLRGHEQRALGSARHNHGRHCASDSELVRLLRYLPPPPARKLLIPLYLQPSVSVRAMLYDVEMTRLWARVMQPGVSYDYGGFVEALA